MREGSRATLAHPPDCLALGRLAAACSLAVLLLTVRMATGGSFTDITLQRTLLCWQTGTSGLCVGLIVLSVLLAARLATLPDRPNLLDLGLLLSSTTRSLALPLLAIDHHDSAVLVPPLAVLAIAAVLLLALRGIRPPTSDT